MPNTINRFKPNSLVKVEKENENNDIRHRFKTAPRVEKASNQRQETVWERLSKVKKTGSNEVSFFGLSKSRLTLITKSSHRLAVNMRTGGSGTSGSSMQKAIRRPLTPNGNTNKHVVIENKPLRKLSISKSIMVDDHGGTFLGCRSVKPNRSVKELLTARSMCNSKTSSDGSKNSAKKADSFRSKFRAQRNYDNQLYDFKIAEIEKKLSLPEVSSQDSLDEYIMAPLIPVPTRDSLNSNIKITKNFQHLLDKRQCTMAPEDIDMIRDVVKTDERYRELQKEDPDLFRDILRSQLQQIVKQENVVKAALKNLDEVETNEKSIENEQNTSGQKLIQKKPQVDVIFKNVPTLEKEIIILKALGEKLEATLRRTVSLHDVNSTASTVDIVGSQESIVPTEKVLELNWIIGIEHTPVVMVKSKGITQQRGSVQEFRIARKTIVELKEDANKHFYLPLNDEKSELKRTCFKKLKETPDVLMRNLKPKSSLVPFNVLDQDPMFFNCFLHNSRVTNTSWSDTAQADSCSDASSEVIQLHEGGDSSTAARRSHQYTLDKETRRYTIEKEPRHYTMEKETRRYTMDKEPLKIEEIVNTSAEPIKKIKNVNHPKSDEVFVDVKSYSKQTKTISPAQEQPIEIPLRAKQRRRIGRSVTPMPLNKVLEPKNNLLKTVLVGSVQISVFLILIMAITYPDVKC